MKVEKYLEIIRNSFSGYANYLWNEITSPTWTSYFYWLIGLSLLVWTLEVLIPWRKEQKPIRKGFWLDSFYIVFNFFLFSLIGYNALSNVAVEIFNDFLGLFGISNIVAFQIDQLPAWTQLLIMFVIADFIQCIISNKRKQEKIEYYIKRVEPESLTYWFLLFSPGDQYL